MSSFAALRMTGGALRMTLELLFLEEPE